MAPDRRRIRAWVWLRKAVQYLALLGFLILFVASRRGGWPPALVNLPMRLDPLAMLAGGLAGRVALTTSALALITVALTLGLGRAWCGWLCPLGTVLDLLSPRQARARHQVSEAWRGVKYVLLLTVLGAALLANLTLMVFDPLTILFRTLSVNVWPALDQGVTVAEFALYRVPFLQEAVSAFDALVRPGLFPSEPVAARYAWLFAAVFVALVGLNWVVPRFWCRYLCPLGGMLGLLSKVSLVRRRVNERCIRCDACARACPTGTIQPEAGYASDPGECTMCLECLVTCPTEAIEFPAHRRPAPRAAYDPGRRQALAALGAAAATAVLFLTERAAGQSYPYCIRPPGVQEEAFISRCVRCGECSRACPTGAIQPALLEAGLEGLWTPVVVPRLGYCDYSCNACGQVCPVGAIPPLPLPEKRQQIMGRAYIDRNRCIPWSGQGACIVCEEMCPVPDKAIRLEGVTTADARGEEITVQRPHVIPERCIGCGICEHKCPAVGEAAIRVQVVL